MRSRIFLSPPRIDAADVSEVTRALLDGWMAPVGPDLDAFEDEVSEYLGVTEAVGVSSGTAALHLILKYVGVKPGDFVVVPTLTFGASAFPVTYLGAHPVFVDVDESWNLDPNLLDEALTRMSSEGKRVAAVMPVDLYGAPANYQEIQRVLDPYGIPLVEDAAEALGSHAGGVKSGAFGRAGALSFNGNKIITTSGGGMIVTNDQGLARKARFWASQSREPYPWYEHREVGYNFRLSNLLAALGRSQFRRVEAEVTNRRQVREWYRDRLASTEGIHVQDDPHWGRSNAWLTVVRFDSRAFPGGAIRVREALESQNIEARPAWKPMHLQPVFSDCRAFLTGKAAKVFEEGLCLPSGGSLVQNEVDEICAFVLEALE